MKKLFLLLGLLVFVLISKTVVAQGVTSAQMQAVYLYNFAKYINWNAQNTEIVIGVVGKSDISKILLSKMGTIKQINGRSWKLVEVSNKSDAQTCNILFLSQSESGRFEEFKTLLKAKPVLLVTEMDLAEQGAPISFFNDSGRLKYKINKKALDGTGLQASFELIKLGVLI